jgi:hypothetical protein
LPCRTIRTALAIGSLMWMIPVRDGASNVGGGGDRSGIWGRQKFGAVSGSNGFRHHGGGDHFAGANKMVWGAVAAAGQPQASEKLKLALLKPGQQLMPAHAGQQAQRVRQRRHRTHADGGSFQRGAPVGGKGPG